MTTRSLAFLAASMGFAAPAAADIVQVQIHGSVEYNSFISGPLTGVLVNAPATLAFTVDSDDFLNSPSFPTRGYPIDPASFTLTMGAVTIGLESPYPAGQTPYFALRDNDPAVDGFLISEVVDFPTNVDTSESNVNMSFLATYKSGTLLSSLDVLDALGTYTLAGISSFQWSLDVGPANPLGMIYESMTISRAAPSCPTDIDDSGAINVNDLLAVIVNWGACAKPDNCPADVAPNGGDDQVNVNDLLAVITTWGSCS